MNTQELALNALLRRSGFPDDESFYDIFHTFKYMPGVCESCHYVTIVRKEAECAKCPACGKDTFYSGIALILKEKENA